MRGLDERLALAIAKLDGQIQGLPPDFTMVYHAATAQGIADFEAERLEPPVLYVTEPALLACWIEGQNFASDLEEMAHCSGCIEARGDPCPFHG